MATRVVCALLLGGSAALFWVGCADEVRTCYPDDYRACTCNDGRRGYQKCASDSSDFGLCDCSLGYVGTDGGTSSGSSGTPTTSGSMPGET